MAFVLNTLRIRVRTTVPIMGYAMKQLESAIAMPSMGEQLAPYHFVPIPVAIPLIKQTLEDTAQRWMIPILTTRKT